MCLGFGLEFWHDLGSRKDKIIGTWNVRSPYRSGSFITVTRELARNKLDGGMYWIELAPHTDR
jgi:hypothetical protein